MAARNEYERYLEGWWQGRSVPDELLRDVVAEISGASVSASERWVRSYSNEVYAVTTVDGQELVVRISRAGARHFDAEHWARANCAARGVPVPRVLGAAVRAIDDVELSCSVEERAPGETLDILTSAGEVDVELREEIVASAGESLAAIHTVQTKGWGPIDDHGRGAHTDATTDLRWLAGLVPGLRPVARKHRLAFHHIEDALGVIEAAPGSDEPCLIHGDFGPKHVMVDQGRVTALLDFENAQGGEPFDDIAFWLYGYRDDVAALRRGYERVSKLDDFDRQLATSWVRVGLCYFAIYGTQDDAASPPGFLAGVARQLRSDLAAARAHD